MRTTLLLCLLLIRPFDVVAQTPPATEGRAGQTPAPTPGGTGQTPPAPPAGSGQTQPPATGGGGKTTQTKPAPAGRATQAPAGRTGVAMMVTDMRGFPLDGVKVELFGSSVTRESETTGGGLANFPGLPAGTYRLLFSGEAVTAFEREVALSAGKVMSIDVALRPAPPPREIVKVAPAPPSPTPAVVGPAGKPQLLSLVDLAERELARKQPGRDTVVSCSGNTRSMLLQLTSDQPERLYESAESLFYVIAGEGVIGIDGKETRLVAGVLASVPRATSFTIGRRGRNPLILLAILSGEPCEEAK